ncbi:MAG: hypothetical protein K2V38_15705 [Gemmataceae bacterium]|nr:hypothetical protein [Gemmataceae bacterium]
MKRFVVAAALAAVLSLGYADTASAQFVQRYTTVTPNGGIVIGNSYGTWGAYQTNRTYISPYGYVGQRAYYGDVFGNTAFQAYGYNAYTGFGYNSGFYQPSPYIAPLGGGYSYNFYGRRW